MPQVESNAQAPPGRVLILDLPNDILNVLRRFIYRKEPLGGFWQKVKEVIFYPGNVP
jgi:hypothetical protein